MKRKLSNVVLASLVKLDGDSRTVERPAPGAAPTAFRIWAAGEVLTDHGVHQFTEASARALLASQAARGNRFSIDVDHLSFSKEAPPEARKAVGWMSLASRRDERGQSELWAVDVEWTAAVKAGIEAKPPEWKYFSPAYRADPKTGEILAYLNTALTNNPATWGVTTLAAMAATGNEGTGQNMTIEEILAALQALADAGDEDAKRMIGAAAPPSAETVKTSEGEDEAKPETVKAAEGEDTAEKAEKAPAVAASALGLVQFLAARVAKLEAQNVESERSKLLASRPDFAPEVVAILASVKTPIEVVRTSVATIKRAAITPAAAAGVEVRATRGETQVDGTADRLPPAEAAELDRRMGLGTRGKAIDDRGSVVVFSAMPSKGAIVATKGGAK